MLFELPKDFWNNPEVDDPMGWIPANEVTDFRVLGARKSSRSPLVSPGEGVEGLFDLADRGTRILSVVHVVSAPSIVERIWHI